MSYISGMMMGFSLGQGLRRILGQKASFPSAGSAGNRAVPGSRKETERGGFRAASVLPGRRRYYVRAVRQNTGLAQTIAARLMACGFVSDAEVNPVTGSVLVRHTDEAAMDSLEEIFRGQLGGGEGKSSRPPVEAPRGNEVSRVKRSIDGSVRDISGWIHERTGGSLDLATLAALFFLVRGVRKCIARGEWASGPQMLWWGLSLLRREGRFL